MSQPVIAAVSQNRDARRALELGEQMARLLGAPLVLAGVAVPMQFVASSPMIGWAPALDDPSELRQLVVDSLNGVSSKVGADVDVSVDATVAASVSIGMETLADAHDAQLVVLGATDRTALTRALDGDPALGLIRHARCAVMVDSSEDATLAPAATTPPKSIGVAWDRSHEAAAALAYAVDLAQRSGAVLHVLHVLEHAAALFVPPANPLIGHELVKVRTKEAEHDLRHAVAELAPDLPIESEIFEGPIGQQLRIASATVDLMVVGSRRVGPIRRVAIGSVSAHLLHHAHCPVIVVPRGVDDGAGA